jgi:hypothetical protein
MCGAITPLPNTPSLRGAQLKERAQGQLSHNFDRSSSSSSSSSKLLDRRREDKKLNRNAANFLRMRAALNVFMSNFY